MAGFERSLLVAAVIAFAGSIVAFALVRQEVEQEASGRARGVTAERAAGPSAAIVEAGMRVNPNRH